MNIPTDEELVRYLDGKLPADRRQQVDQMIQSDASVVSRLTALDLDTDALREAFESVLEHAPAHALPAIATQAGVQPEDQQAKQSGGFGLLPLAASVLIALAIGFGAASYLSGQSETTDWRQAVVDYQQLYTLDTLPAAVPSAQLVRSQLARVSKNSGLTITQEMVQLPGLTFKRAQTLGHDGKPLVQLVYSDENGTPVALCFMPAANKSEPQASRIDGMNTVSWENGDYGFILVSHSDPALLNQIAQEAQSRF